MLGSPSSRPRVDRPVPVSGQPTYQDIRKEIATGDLLLFSGAYRLSKIIGWATHCPYSHAGILAKWDGRIVAFQSDTRGVEVLPASTMVCRYNGKVDWWALKPEYRAKLDKERFFDTALTLLGLRFGYWGIIRFGLRLLFGWTFNRRQDAQLTPNSMFCSQFVSNCYRNGGLTIDSNLDDELTSPAVLASSPFFESRLRLYDGSGGDACKNLLVRPARRGRLKKAAVWTGEHRLPPSGPTARPPGSLLP
jgi:hypothetical protein